MILVDTNVATYLLIDGYQTATAVAQKDPEWDGPRLGRS